MSAPQADYGLHWFRRDLRLRGNPALTRNLGLHDGRVVGVFFFDSGFLSRPDFSPNRFGFFLKSLSALRDELRAAGGELLVLDAPPAVGFPLIFEALRARGRVLPKQCSFNRDYEPFARARDSEARRQLQEDFGVETITAADHLLLEPGQVLRPDSGTYQVFTPFSRAWQTALAGAEPRQRLVDEKNARRRAPRFTLGWRDVFGGPCPLADKLEAFVESNRTQVTVPLPAAGSEVAWQKLAEFKTSLADYEVSRDVPSWDRRSTLSLYLKNGSLTTAQVFAELGAAPGARPFLRQLIWREFYYHILFHHPRVEHEAFREKYKNIAWRNQADWFEAWKQGRTGFPLVDAGMRELLATGLMHNRLRMVVASFLTKDLLIDWRWGERWFMRNLLDGDLAANNGGWQWAASTGCDPQPYFRIFNPLLQSKRYDPKGEYIRTYLPELRALSDRDVHAPPERVRPASYPAPIVAHVEQKFAALRLYR